MSEAFNKKAMTEALMNHIVEGTTLEEAQEQASNEHLWITGYYKSAKALEEFDEDDQQYERTDLNGVFGAIQYVQDYENNQLGEIFTDVSNPEKLSSAVAWINMDLFVNDICGDLDIDLYQELNSDDINKINNYLN